MSDNATLITALNRYAADGEVVSDLHEAAARIAELEAEVARLTAEQARVPPDRELIAASLTEIADGKQEWSENWTEIEIMREAALALRTPADGFRAGVEAMRKACAKVADDAGWAKDIAAAIRSLDIPSQPAEETP